MLTRLEDWGCFLEEGAHETGIGHSNMWHGQRAYYVQSTVLSTSHRGTQSYQQHMGWALMSPPFH